MRLEIVDPKTLSLSDLMDDLDQLFYIYSDPEAITTSYPAKKGVPRLYPMSDGRLSRLNEDALLIRIIPGEDPIFTKVEEKTEEKKATRSYERRTYGFNGSDPTETIMVEYRPAEGDIRVNFKDKEIAEKYFNYFREQFYTSTTGASVITVSNIYKDLNVVNWNPEDCDDWGWYTLDNGTCRYITEVMKTRNSKLWGFTLKKPTKLYETKKKA